LCITIKYYNKWSYVLDFESEEVKEVVKVLWDSAALSVNLK